MFTTDDAVHLPRNWHLNAVLLRQLDHHTAGLDAFGDHVHGSDNLIRSHAFRKFHADLSIARQRTHTGGQQIAKSSQAREGFRTATECHAQPADFRQAARNHQRAGVLTHTQAVSHARRYGHDIFQWPAQFTADDVRVGVDAKHGA